MALAFIAETAGEEAAGQVQFATEYYPSNQKDGTHHKTNTEAPANTKDFLNG